MNKALRILRDVLIVVVLGTCFSYLIVVAFDLVRPPWL